MKKVNRVLVIGGTGMLGFPVVKQLLKDNFKVRVLARNVKKAEQMFGKKIEIAEGKIEDESSLLKALKNCDAVHINLNGGPAPEDYDKIEHLGTAAVVKAAQKMQITKVTYLSGLYTRSDPDVKAPSVLAKYKAEEFIKNSGINYSIFRSTWFMESLPLFVQGKKAMLIGKQPKKLSWLAVEEYAVMVSASFRNLETNNRIFDVYGPEKCTMKEALEIYLKIVLPEVKIKKTPIFLIKLMANISRKPELKSLALFMEHASKNGETGNPEETNQIFGAPVITIEKWAEARNQIITKTQ